MRGKTVLITGATGGIGFQIAAALAAEGARVFVTGRDEAHGRQALVDLRRQAGHDAVEFLRADASSLRETQLLADEVMRRSDRLDVLINNAGGLFPQRRETPEGLESTLALNFASACLLTRNLLALLSRSGPARIINVVSSSFSMWKRDPLEDLGATDHYVALQAHAHAKLLALLWTLGLARRLAGSALVANAVNPGMAWTPATAALTREAVPQWRFIWPVVRWFQRRASAEKAARGPVYLASAADAGISGRYFDEMTEKRLPARLLDPSLQDRVWELGETLVARATGSAPSPSPL